MLFLQKYNESLAKVWADKLQSHFGGFLGWIEGYSGSIPRKSNLKNTKVGKKIVAHGFCKWL